MRKQGVLITVCSQILAHCEFFHLLRLVAGDRAFYSRGEIWNFLWFLLSLGLTLCVQCRQHVFAWQDSLIGNGAVYTLLFQMCSVTVYFETLFQKRARTKSKATNPSMPMVTKFGNEVLRGLLDPAGSGADAIDTVTGCSPSTRLISRFCWQELVIN